MADQLPHLREQVLTALAEQTPLVLQGNGTKQDLGRSLANASRPTAKLILHEHQGIIDYSPAELVLRVRAGTRLDTVQQLLAENNQRLAFEPPDYGGAATIGGTVAANQSGPATPWFGGVKDSILGIGLINGLGESIHFGGQVMKNVAGFDVSRLQVGAMGVFGVITEVSLKVLPVLPAQETLVIPAKLSDALTIMPTFLTNNLPVSAVTYWQQQIYVRFQGGQSAVEAAVQKTQNQYGGYVGDAEKAQQFWQSNREQHLLTTDIASASNNTEWVLWRADVAANNDNLMVADDCLLNWAGAQRWQCLSAVNDMPVMDINLVQYRGGDRSRDVYGEVSDVNKTLQTRLKSAFDPQGIFNIGRLYSWM